MYGLEAQRDMTKEFGLLTYLEEMKKFTAKDWAKLIKR
jgi:hypothetical protein